MGGPIPDQSPDGAKEDRTPESHVTIAGGVISVYTDSSNGRAGVQFRPRVLNSPAVTLYRSFAAYRSYQEDVWPVVRRKGTIVDTAQIGQYGEQHVAAWLRQQGYTVNQNTKLPGSTDIQADGPKSILVQVKTAVPPNEPSYPSSDEIRNIKSRATNTNRSAYIARVKIDSEAKLVGEIKWTKP